MKTLKILIGIFAFGLLLQSCTGDIEDLEDQRDAIVNKKFRVVETEKETGAETPYDDKILKDDNETTDIIFTNFHAVNIRVKATLAGNNITIKEQTIEDYTVEGNGTITEDLKSINLTYKVDEGQDNNPISYSANYSPPTVAKSIKPMEIKPIRQIN